ncbi:MAG: hypothetical protein WCV70_00765 [Patescibacteria group bacterium]|jgi:hypothetical protein
MQQEKITEMLPWDKRIPNMAKEKVIEKIKSAGINEKVKEEALKTVEEIFNDQSFPDAKQINEWGKILAKIEPEKVDDTEKEMAEQFALMGVKDELKKRGISLII